MKFLITGRQTGKTTRLIAMALEFAKRFPTVVVVHNEQRERELSNQYRKEIIGTKLEIIHLRRLLAMPKKYFERMLIDDIDLHLATILYQHVTPETGRITTITGSGIPMADLDSARKGASMLWRQAIEMLDKASALDVYSLKIILRKQFEDRALELEALLPAEPTWQE